MAKVSYEEILSIQRKVNIVDVIRDYVSLTQKGKNFFGICPFHDDHNPSMSVSADRQMYRCFVCGASGNVFNFVSEYEKVSYYEAVKIVANKTGIDIDIGNIDKSNIVKSPLYDIYDITSKFYQNNLNTNYGKKAKEYLKNRQIDDSVIKEFKIGLSTMNTQVIDILKSKGFSEDDILKSGVCVKNKDYIHDLYKDRIMFPLFDLEGNIIAFSGRVYDNSSENKYINTMETQLFKKGNLLYNYHIAKKEARIKKNIIVVEGFMDVIRLSTIGIRNVVATMGTAVTKYQASLIRKLSPNIIVMFDGDSAGDKATKSFLELFNNSDASIKVVRLEDNLDPDEYILKNGADKMNYHLSHPMTRTSYKLDSYKENIDFNNSEDVSKYINLIIPELEMIDDDIVRNLEIKKVSQLTGISIDTISSKINKKDIDKIIIKNHNYTNNKIDKYIKASDNIIYNMIKNNNYILYYYDNLSYLPDPLYKKLANEIVLFYKKFESFNINDFIVYLEDKKDLINILVKIDNMPIKLCENVDELNSYFKTIKEYISKKKINDLLNKLKTETNEITRKEIAKEIVDIKKKESM